MFDVRFAGKIISWLVVSSQKSAVTAAQMQIGQFPVCDPHCTVEFCQDKYFLEFNIWIW